MIHTGFRGGDFDSVDFADIDYYEAQVPYAVDFSELEERWFGKVRRILREDDTRIGLVGRDSWEFYFEGQNTERNESFADFKSDIFDCYYFCELAESLAVDSVIIPLGENVSYDQFETLVSECYDLLGDLQRLTFSFGDIEFSKMVNHMKQINPVLERTMTAGFRIDSDLLVDNGFNTHVDPGFNIVKRVNVVDVDIGVFSEYYNDNPLYTNFMDAIYENDRDVDVCIKSSRHNFKKREQVFTESLS